MQMQKTTPEAPGAIFIDTYKNGIRNRSNYTTKKVSSKYFKPPPFADRIYKQSSLWHVYLGEDSITRVENDYEKHGPWHRIAAMALPWNADPFKFDWQVQGQVVDILSAGMHSQMVQQLGDALHECGALHVYGRVNGNVTHWHSQELAA